jgi:hypothetical protein
MDEDWEADLVRWLGPYLEGLGNKTRRQMCPAYISGLIGPRGSGQMWDRRLQRIEAVVERQQRMPTECDNHRLLSFGQDG